MVIVISWIESWVLIVISVSALFGVAVLLSCVCWEYKRRNLKDLYIFNKTTMSALETKDAKSETNDKPVSFSNYSKLEDNLLERASISGKATKIDELLESTNSFNFDQVRLEIDTPEDREDTISFRSADSKNTYYSIYPITRASSIAETMKSAFSQVDLSV